MFPDDFCDAFCVAGECIWAPLAFAHNVTADGDVADAVVVVQCNCSNFYAVGY